MKSILGPVADLSGNNSWNAFLSRSLSPPTINIIQKRPKSWICRRCCHLNQDVQPSKFIKLTKPLILRPLKSQYSRLHDRSIYTSVRKAESIDDKSTKTTTRNDLPSAEEGRRSQISKRFTHLMDHLQSNIFIAGQRLNDLTGYSGIEALKKEIKQQEQLVKSTRASLQSAREAYSKAINQRSGSQREVNELLQRKHAWSSEDLERFTALYRSDHANEQAEAAAQENLANAEREAEEAGARLSSCILARYHEEQIWSDKIRRMSTWGTWGLMGVNILLFLVFQIAVEPWRRKRLVKGFEEKVMEALEREGAPIGVASIDEVAIQDPAPVEVEDGAVPKSATEESLGEISPPLEGVPLSASNVTEVQPSTGSELSPSKPLSRLESIKTGFQDMFSERQITVRRVDLTTAMLKGTAAGLAFVGVLVLVLRPR